MSELIKTDRTIKDAMIAYEVLIFSSFNWNYHQRECLLFKSGEMVRCEECGEVFFKWKMAKAAYLEKIKEMIG